MTDCKKALVATSGDFEAAIKWLQQHGAAKAVKKGDRVTDHGVLIAAVAPNCAGAGILQLCSETDFASRNERFLEFADSVRLQSITLFQEKKHGLLEHGIPQQEFDARRAAFLEQLKQAVEDGRTQAVAKMGENISLKEIFCLPPLTPEQKAGGVIPSDLGDLFGSYVHNSVAPYKHVGTTAAIVQLQPRDAESAARICPEIVEADDFAQHCVANLGCDGAITQQNFLGGDETAGAWLKKHHLKLQRALVLKFGEVPQYHTLSVAPPNVHKKGEK
jgi:elongation factor Ts